jgi:hypothetical protein
MTTLAELAAEFNALTPQVEAAKLGTAHEGHIGWSLGGEPYIARCSCGTPLDDALRQRDWFDQAFRVAGDEDGGVGLDCRLCDRGGAPIAYYSWPDDRTYEGTDVVRVSTISALLDAGQQHLAQRHAE